MSGLVIRNLCVTYGSGDRSVPAVRGVDVDVLPGATVGVAGESGCGKSTVALAVLRLLPRTAQITGQLQIEDEDVLTMRWGRLRAVRWAGASIVFQGAMHSLNPVHRVGDQIAEPILLHASPPGGAGSTRTRVDTLLEQVGLARQHARSYPHELSGGQRQRVMIAMALACDPRIIVADEPTTALDVMIQAQILRLLGRLVREHGIGLMMISHDLSVLAHTCDRLMVMYAGRVVEEGPAQEVFRAPRHPYSVGLRAAFPTIGDPGARRRPHGLPGDPPDPAALPTGCSFRPRCDVSEGRCATVDPVLWPVPDVHTGPRAAACVRVLSPTPEPEHGNVVEETDTL
ncbi:ABC transporter ATP-binding protein [Lipingzhangella sp. LS1_29]|uniref:ABC transporter ATP-binding protein n=1 Tax=Lipingzhangella rawalii TaxID=2055835 RepID=A0ABU2H2L6_9ACTN|nr:ABC transporter ATP-binding protein [Lipingzhangella rawalii]MDS1269549.1 ABC transporter ATP-binding protein [Lipingzhangella rawalii]